MTLREAIRLRCEDCEGRNCDFTKCELFSMGKRGNCGNRSKAIRKYCRWCMNGHRINECAATPCSIYQFRKNTSGDLHVDFLPGISKRRVP
jgi:hypothetical protein